MQKLRVGIVGCGSIFHYHYNFIKTYTNADVVAIADRDEEALRKASTLYGLKNTYTELEEMIRKENTNVIHITTPPQTHASLAETAMLLKNHVFVEKPVALNYQEAFRLFEVAKKNEVRLCVDHNHLFDPWMLKARNVLNKLNKSDVIYVESYYGINVNIPEIMNYRGINEISWIFDLPGGLFHDFITHPLYLLLEYTGKPLRIRTMSRSCGALFQDLSDELHVMVDGENAIGKMTISFNARPFQHFLKIYHKKMIVNIDFNNMTTVILPLSKLPGAATKITSNLSVAKQLTTQVVSNVLKFVTGKLKPYSGMKKIIHSFYDSIMQSVELPISPDQALAVIQVSDELWKNIEKIHPVFENVSPLSTQKANHKGKVLITGASGFLGKRLTETLTEKGYAVRVLIRKLSKIDLFKRLGVDIHYGDIRDEIILKKAINGMDYVVHAAAAQEGDWDTFDQTTIKGTANVFKFAKALDVKRMIYISSMSIYQISGLKSSSIISEDAKFEEDPQARGFYSWSKVEAEKIIRQAISSKVGVQAVILRPATIYGPEGPVFTPLIGVSLFDKIFVVLGKASMKLPLVYIDNLIDSIIIAIEKEGVDGEVFNIIDDVQISKREYVRKYIKKAFPHSISIFLPYPLVYAAVLAQEIIFKSARRKPILTRYRLISASTEIRYDNSKAKEKLGWIPKILIEEGLYKMFKQFQENGK